MPDFLASFNLSAQTVAPSHSPSCDSIDDLQRRLRTAFDEKVTPTRAEHISTILEFRALAQFTLSIPEPENGAIEGLNNIDPSLGGIQPATASETQDERQVSRVVGAHEALMNQPKDNPILQRSVAKHMITAISAIDGSTWAVREVSFGSQGWTFTYLCKESCQQWSRAHAKTAAKLIVGEYSLREPDLVLSSRPAFDCRGSVTISFNRDSRTISIKYDHTPLHKTVAELSEYFRPPPRQLGPGAERQPQQNTQQQKTPRKSRTERRAQEEKTSSRKRKKNSDATSQNAAPMAAMQVIEFQALPEPAGTENGASTADDTQAINALAQIQNSDQHTADLEQDQPASVNYPQQLLDGTSATAAAQTRSSTRSSQPPPGVIFPVNITPAEAARRRDAATALLSDAGVPPDSLSAEQFSIFSNQSPELQKESLNMLIQYGAERLRIVHPGTKGGSTAGQTSSTSNSTLSGHSVSPQPTTADELVPQSGSSDAGHVSAPGAGDNEVGMNQVGSSKKPRRKMGKSRNACFPCKARKVKCPRERPVCSECQTANQICEYAPQKPRKQKKKTDVDTMEMEVEGGEEEAIDEDAEGYEPNHDETIQNPSHEYSSSSHIPATDPLLLNAEQTDRPLYAAQDDYVQARPGLSLPHHDGVTVAPHNVLADPTRHPGHQAISGGADTASTTQERWGVGDSVSRTRRSLPSGPGRAGPQAAPFENSQSSSNGSVRGNYSGQATSTASRPEQMPDSGGRVSPSVNHYRATGSHEIRDGMRQASALAQAAIQQHHSPTTATAAISAQTNRSPFQNTSTNHTTSRQDQRTQSHNQSTGVYPPPPNPIHHSRTNSSGNQTFDRTNRVSTHNAYSHYSTNAKTSHQANQGTGGHESSLQMRGTSSVTTTQSPSQTLASASMAAPSTSSYAASSNHWSGSRVGNGRAHGSASVYHTESTYARPSSSNIGSDSRKTHDTTSRTQFTRSGSGSFSQQQQSYSSYPPPQHQQTEESNQPSSWYNFNNSNSSSFTSANNSSGYSWS